MFGRAGDGNVVSRSRERSGDENDRDVDADHECALHCVGSSRTT
jgi:hypothetical protein